MECLPSFPEFSLGSDLPHRTEVVQLVISVPGKWRPEDQKFKAILWYLVNSRLAWATGTLVLKQNKHSTQTWVSGGKRTLTDPNPLSPPCLELKACGWVPLMPDS